MDYNTNFIVDEESVKESKRKLRQRFVAGILTGALIASFVIMAVFIFGRPAMGLAPALSQVQSSSGDELLNDTTVNKIHSR